MGKRRKWEIRYKSEIALISLMVGAKSIRNPFKTKLSAYNFAPDKILLIELFSK